MTIQTSIRCDICNSPLKENDIVAKGSMFKMSNKPESKHAFALTLNGHKSFGHLCYPCSIKIRNKIEEMKMESQ